MVADYCSVHGMRTRYEYSTAENMKPFVVVQSLSCIWLFVTPWTAARQASLSFTISWRMLKLTSFELMMLSNHRILCHLFFSCLQSFPASGSFPVNWLFASSGQSVGASTSTLVLPVNIQSWFPLGLTSLISLLSKELSMLRDWGLGSLIFGEESMPGLIGYLSVLTWYSYIFQTEKFWAMMSKLRQCDHVTKRISSRMSHLFVFWWIFWMGTGLSWI